MSEEFIEAVKKDDYRVVEQMLQSGREKPDILFRGCTPLIICCIKGHTKTAKVLLGSGADTNLKDNSGQSALHHASCSGHIECLCLLLNNVSIKVNLQMRNGCTALFLAVLASNTEAVKLLLDYPKIDINIEDDDGRTVFSACESEEILALLNTRAYTDKIEKKKLEIEEMREEMEKLEFINIDKKICEAENNLKEFKIELGQLNQQKKAVEEKIAQMEPNECVLETKLDELRKQREIMVKERETEQKDESWADCPICYEVMKSPKVIYQCPEGHCICSGCRGKVNLCPTCKVNLDELQSRNRALEELINRQFK